MTAIPDNLRFANGRSLYCWGRVSPGADGGLYEGYDDIIEDDEAFQCRRLPVDDYPHFGRPPLTHEERCQVAKIMIQRWKEWAAMSAPPKAE